MSHTKRLSFLACLTVACFSIAAAPAWAVTATDSTTTNEKTDSTSTTTDKKTADKKSDKSTFEQQVIDYLRKEDNAVSTVLEKSGGSTYNKALSEFLAGGGNLSTIQSSLDQKSDDILKQYDQLEAFGINVNKTLIDAGLIDPPKKEKNGDAGALLAGLWDFLDMDFDLGGYLGDMFKDVANIDLGDWSFDLGIDWSFLEVGDLGIDHLWEASGLGDVSQFVSDSFGDFADVIGDLSDDVGDYMGDVADSLTETYKDYENQYKEFQQSTDIDITKLKPGDILAGDLDSLDDSGLLDSLDFALFEYTGFNSDDPLDFFGMGAYETYGEFASAVYKNTGLDFRGMDINQIAKDGNWQDAFVEELEWQIYSTSGVNFDADSPLGYIQDMGIYPYMYDTFQEYSAAVESYSGVQLTEIDMDKVASGDWEGALVPAFEDVVWEETNGNIYIGDGLAKGAQDFGMGLANDYAGCDVTDKKCQESMQKDLKDGAMATLESVQDALSFDPGLTLGDMGIKWPDMSLDPGFKMSDLIPEGATLGDWGLAEYIPDIKGATLGDWGLAEYIPDIKGKIDWGAYSVADLGFDAEKLKKYLPNMPDLGTIDLGSVSLPDLGVDIGSLDIGDVDLGKIDIGDVDLGKIDIGDIDFGTLTIGDMTPDFLNTMFSHLTFGDLPEGTSISVASLQDTGFDVSDLVPEGWDMSVGKLADVGVDPLGLNGEDDTQLSGVIGTQITGENNYNSASALANTSGSGWDIKTTNFDTIVAKKMNLSAATSGLPSNYVDVNAAEAAALPAINAPQLAAPSTGTFALPDWTKTATKLYNGQIGAEELVAASGFDAEQSASDLTSSVGAGDYSSDVTSNVNNYLSSANDSISDLY